MKNSLRKGIIRLLVAAVLIGAGVPCYAGGSPESEPKLKTGAKTQVSAGKPAVSYPIVDTAQGFCYDNRDRIGGPAKGKAFYGQDAQYAGNVPKYTDNGDGTVTDNVTGLIWTQELSESSMVWSDAGKYAESLTTGGIKTWRVPTIKELWSIRDFSQGWPWVDTDYFRLAGNGREGAQQHSWTSNFYLVKTDKAVKNVAFAVDDLTGQIKASAGKRFVRCVSGKPYGINDFADNGNGTVSDKATGLMWAKNDSGKAMDWETALSYAEGSTYAGYYDWRLPNVKELQSLVDYSGVYPAIDRSVFNISRITNEAGISDYPYFWTSTTNSSRDPRDVKGRSSAWYVAFGYAVDTKGNDIHGAGAVRFDSKSKDGPGGIDAERGVNYVRLVRGGAVKETPSGDLSAFKPKQDVSLKNDEEGAPEERPDGPGGPGGPGGSGPGGEHGRPDFAAAAAKLGLSEKTLMGAMGEPEKGPPDFAAVAKALGITEEELLDALEVPKQEMPPAGRK